MRAVVQRVSRARVLVDGAVVGEIGPGLCILLGVAQTDDEGPSGDAPSGSAESNGAQPADESSSEPSSKSEGEQGSSTDKAEGSKRSRRGTSRGAA